MFDPTAKPDLRDIYAVDLLEAEMVSEGASEITPYLLALVLDEAPAIMEEADYGDLQPFVLAALKQKRDGGTYTVDEDTGAATIRLKYPVGDLSEFTVRRPLWVEVTSLRAKYPDHGAHAFEVVLAELLSGVSADVIKLFRYGDYAVLGQVLTGFLLPRRRARS